MSLSLKLNNPSEWHLSPASGIGAKGRGRRRAALALDFPDAFLAPGVSVEQVLDATPTTVRRAAGLPMLDLSITPVSGESYAIAIRHASGALTFHGPDVELTQGRRGAVARRTLRFRAPLRSTRTGAQRRGVLGDLAKIIVLKVATKIADATLPVLAATAEAAIWTRAGLSEGWFKVDESSLRTGKLRPAAPTQAGPCGRVLLLLHGTFSHGAAAFKGLVGTDFFARVVPQYGDQIFAFNHFTISKSPEENARKLLEGLSDRTLAFDVITHSRGGLVLRNLAERGAALGAGGSRFNLHHAVLVASPNDGTPLATPERWDQTVGWFANLIEMFPDNPLTFATGFVAEAIVWIAHRLAGGLPGLASMDSAGDAIAELQRPPGPAAAAYSALAANFLPTEGILARMLDVGIDSFFASANDLVVPTEGGWLIDRGSGSPAIPADRIGCFGPGGNFAAHLPAVHHLNFFQRNETAKFLAKAINGEAQGLPEMDPATALPDSRLRRRLSAASQSESARRQAAPPSSPEPRLSAAELELSPVFSDALQITLIAPRANRDEQAGRSNGSGLHPYQLMASYGGARIIEPFTARGGEAGQRWRKIIAMHERIKSYVDGKLGFETPSEDELVQYGIVLFETLFPREVRRLYDVARSRERSGHLNVIFTSMIPWVADKPWEFAFDPDRKTFLATQELHFIRNALTAVPAEVIRPRSGPLRILVAVAQPIGTERLSSEQEETVIRRGFQPLVETGLVEIDVLRSTTPMMLHKWLTPSRSYDVVHFIGHGMFDETSGKGYLLFEDEKGRAVDVDVRNACEILCQREIRLVFLNACETGRGERSGTRTRKADFNRGIAPGLVANGVPAVVANQFSVSDLAATEFAQHFYWALAQGATFGTAAREARIAVNYSTSHDTIDWAVPVVYARDPESRLCRPRAITLEMITSPLVAPSARRATARHQFRVAVWDINHLFPGIERTVARLNAAQPRYGFEVVDISIPMGAWQRYKGGGLQLHANVAARGLNNKRQELAVDFIFCITDKPIMYEDGGERFSNYECWWSDPGQENIIIFSAAYEGLPTDGPGADHAIANAIVQGLTGILADVGTHARGPKNCPLYWNEELDMRLAVQRQSFDARCKQRLKKSIPDDLPALRALLDAFD